jgi:hypothetical protein
MSAPRPTISYPTEGLELPFEGLYAFGSKPRPDSLIYGVLVSRFAFPIVGKPVDLPSTTSWMLFFDGLERDTIYSLVVFDLGTLTMADPVKKLVTTHSLRGQILKDAGKHVTAIVKFMYPNSNSFVPSSFAAFGTDDEGVSQVRITRDATGVFQDGTRITASAPYTFNFWFEGVPKSTSNTDFYTLVATGAHGGTDTKVKLIIR